MAATGQIRAILATVLLVCAFSAGRAHGQEPALDAFYSQLEPKESFRYKWKADGPFREGTCTTGVFRWAVPASEFGTMGLDRNFTGYCAEVLVPIVAGKVYRFRVNNIYDPTNYNLTSAPKDKVGDAANRRTRLVQELFERYFRDPLLKDVHPTDAIAFQVALWEIIQEPEPAEGEPKLDVFEGDFQANYPRAEAPAYVTRAQGYLSTLTGKGDALWGENPDMRGRELIRLQGVGNAEGTVAQSQFALQYSGRAPAGRLHLLAPGGPAGNGVGNPAAATGNAPAAGSPTGLPATGTGGSPPAENQTSQFQSPIDPVRAEPPLNGPSDSSPSFQSPIDAPRPNQFESPIDPPRGDPLPAPRPVPAPAGFVLGVLALGGLGARNVWARLRCTK